MLQRTLTMSFNDAGGKKRSISIKDIKEEIPESDVTALMDSIVANKLIITENGDLAEKVSAQIVNKETTELTI
jgi:Protein of unknown function (DUF2922)